MKVADLITALQTMPPETEVLADYKGRLCHIERGVYGKHPLVGPFVGEWRRPLMVCRDAENLVRVEHTFAFLIKV